MKRHQSLVLFLLLVLIAPVFGQSVNARNLLKLGRSYAEAGEWKKVIEYADQAMQEEPGYLDALYLRAFAHRELEEYKKAEDDFRMIIRSEPQFLQTYGALADMFLKQKEYEKADKLFTELSQQPKGSKWASYYRGVVAYLQQDLETAERHWKDTIERDPRFSMAQHNLGAIYLARGDYKRSLTFMREAAEQQPEQIMYSFHVAWVLERLGRMPQAQKILKDIMNGDASDQKNWLLARALFQINNSKPGQALKVLETVTKQNPDNLDVWVLKARAHLALGQPQEAREAALKAQELDPKFGEVKELLAKLPAPDPSPPESDPESEGAPVEAVPESVPSETEPTPTPTETLPNETKPEPTPW